MWRICRGANGGLPGASTRSQEFLNTAKRYDLSGDDSSDTENKESSGNGPAGLVPPPKAQRRG